MKERPINLREHEVQTVLKTGKIQLRRPMSNQREVYSNSDGGKRRIFSLSKDLDKINERLATRFPHPCDQIKSPFGKPGDRLWGRETWRPEYEPDTGEQILRYRKGAEYGPFGDAFFEVMNGTDHWRSPVTIPRWASRILLEVVSVKVERVQEITCRAARESGVITDDWDEWREDASNVGLPSGSTIQNERDVFESVWDSIYAKRGYGWDTNPYVWVIEFRRIEP